MKRAPFLLLALMTTVAQAQVHPQPSGGDPRMQTIDYQRNQVVQIKGAAGYQVMIALAPDERIQNVAVGDSGAWQVVASQSSNMLFVRPMQGGVSTNMTVITSARFYAFDLVPVAYGSPPYEVRFNYPVETASRTPGVPVEMGEQIAKYRLSGTKALWPDAISDDGAKTYIDWPAEAGLPAVFVVDAYGQERLANGNMRCGFYVIDGVHQELLFRIDRKAARAKRYVPKGRAP